MHFDKWLTKRRWDIEQANEGFPTYYGPIGRPGYSKLSNTHEKTEYDLVWNRYFFAGVMRMPFSPYIQMIHPYPPPLLPFDVAEIEAQGFYVPSDIKTVTGYREFLALLEHYGQQGLSELRSVNPITRDRPPESIESED